MDVSCPSLPPKILLRNETDAELRPNEQTTAYMAAHGCHLSTGFWYVLLVIIESFSSQCASQVSAQPFLYKTGLSILSRTFSEKPANTYPRSLGLTLSIGSCLRSKDSDGIDMSFTALCLSIHALSCEAGGIVS